MLCITIGAKNTFTPNIIMQEPKSVQKLRKFLETTTTEEREDK